ncbi:hypothetical protein [Ligilactobacillus acidipiscis]|uniref:hypothetical protein n=1 Tax=Ligilactobacillus acidipiscis TaxID=89059 RepID=UPI0023F708C8|nr:hypothetical protein [Ligilactobacillus acidipiscis]WEV57436.1 hypothetical protein OZX66_02510 [Ligilactobacillus acidipiscis]
MNNKNTSKSQNKTDYSDLIKKLECDIEEIGPEKKVYAWFNWVKGNKVYVKYDFYNINSVSTAALSAGATFELLEAGLLLQYLKGS